MFFEHKLKFIQKLYRCKSGVYNLYIKKYSTMYCMVQYKAYIFVLL